MGDIRKNMRHLRRDFNYATLNKSEVPKQPLDLLKQWLDQAIKEDIKDANAFVLSTSVNGFPDSRILLIRDITDKGIQFYTNYQSKKGNDLEKNFNASINVFWPDLERQIRIHVEVEKIDPELSDDYFHTRPRASQIGAWASKQSSILHTREDLENGIKELEERFKGIAVPRPDFWGGYIAKPSYFEFWQGRPSRLHDRISYTRNDGLWEINRLYP